MTDIPLHLLSHALMRVKELGNWGPVVFIPVYVVATALFVPTVLLALAAGAFFGIPLGIAVTSAASLLSAAGFFAAGRYFTRSWVLKKIGLNKKFVLLDECVASQSWKIILCLRLAAIIPFSALNYTLGATRISLKNYLGATWLGMLPGILLYVYLGSLAGTMAFGSGRKKSPLEWALMGFGIALSFGVGLSAAHAAKKEIDRTCSKICPDG